MISSNRNSRPLSLAIGFSALAALIAACDGDAAPPSAAAETADPVITQARPQEGTPATVVPSEDQAAAAAPSRKYSGPDIMGIYLGMSPEEVMAVLKADPSGFQKIQRSEYTFSYTAHGNKYKTDPFLRGIVGVTKGSEVNLEIGISPPPSTPQVIGIRRNHTKREQRLPMKDYADALIEKYGPPASDVTEGQGPQLKRKLTWSLPGGTRDCISPGSNVTESVLEKFKDAEGRRTEARREEVQECAHVFEYTLYEDPVRTALGYLIDVARAAEFEFMARDWVDQLAAEKAKPATERPAL